MPEFLRAADFNNSWKDLRTIEVGHQVKINHVGCIAGTDTRSRLYIKRTAEQQWVGFCHNCGLGGVWRDGRVLSFNEIAEYTKTKDTALSTTPKVCLQVDQEHLAGDSGKNGWHIYKPQEMDSERVFQYLTKFPAAHGLYFHVNESEEKIRLSIINNTEVVGHSERCFNPMHGGPKWKITYYTDHTGVRLCDIGPNAFKQYFYKGYAEQLGPKILLITEDIISARAADKYVGCTTVALLRTTIDSGEFHRILDLADPDRIILAMDRDIPGRTATERLFAKCGLLAKPHVRIDNLWNLPGYKESNAKDFKDLSIDEIKGIRKT